MTRIDDYREALRRAEEKLKLASLSELAQKAGATLTYYKDSACCIRLIFFKESATIQIGESLSIAIEGQEQEVPIEEKIILCHYLVLASGASSSRFRRRDRAPESARPRRPAS